MEAIEMFVVEAERESEKIRLVRAVVEASFRKHRDERVRRGQ
jgi:hypothetical protein